MEYESEGALKTAYLRVNSVPSYLNSFPSGCVILTAGSLNSPKLLMMSGIGPPSTLREFGINALVASDAVGSNVQDHISVGMSYRLDPEALARFPSMFSFPSLLVKYLAEVEDYKAESLNYTRSISEQRDFGVLGSAGLSVGAFLKSPFASSDGGPDIQLSVLPAATEPHIAARAWWVLHCFLYYMYLSCRSVNATPDALLHASGEMLVTVCLLNPDASFKVVISLRYLSND